MNEIEILKNAPENVSEAELKAYLNEACGGDSDLLLRIGEFLKLDAEAAAFMKRPVVEQEASGRQRPLVERIAEGGLRSENLAHSENDGPSSEEESRQIGPYKLLEKLGEGGFGSVWAAEQKDPIKRRVALKIIKLGMDTKQVVARFEAERQALALMDHPNIAKVLDAGATDEGRPYFVMELVRGVAITKYCNREKLGTLERLDLFIKICQAIQHAHQKGIIHRDIKPSNILVTLHDGVPVPKVIDFGIAKATQQELTEKTVYTQFHQFIGTPAYMSPEQAEMSGLDIDTRSDVYSLGVLLYELLTGAPPFNADELMRSGLDEMRKIIREKEPIRPSTRLNQTLSKASTSSPVTRHTSLPSDLDWIVMKCLEKDRARRYDTANALVVDLHRHLTNEPVLARPPSTVYKIRKAWRRNRVVCAAGLAIAASLLAGITLSLWQAALATRAKDEAQINYDKAVAAEGKLQETLNLAENERDRAVDIAEELRRHTYASDMGLAHQSINAGDLGRARRLLDKYYPNADEQDLRGFEWRYLWSQSQGDQQSDLGPYVGFLSGVTISPDGQFVALNRQDPSRIEVIHLASGKVAKSIPVESDVVPLTYSPSGDLLLGARTEGEDLALGWNTQTWNAYPPMHLTFPVAFGYLDDKEILVACEGEHLSIWDAAAWEKLSTLENLPASGKLLEPAIGLDAHMMNALAVSSQSSIVYLAGVSNIRRWDLIKRKELAPLPRGGMTCLAISENGQLAGGDATGGVFLINSHNGEISHAFQSHVAWTSCVRFTRDGSRLLSASSDRNIVIHDPVNRSTIRRLLGHRQQIRALDIAADGKTIVSGAGHGDSVLTWSLNESESESVQPRDVIGFNVLEDERILLFRSGSSDLEYVDPLKNTAQPAHAGALARALRRDQVQWIRFAPNAKWAASLDGDCVSVWNVFAGDKERTLKHDSGAVKGFEFSPNSQFLLTVGDQEIRLWRTGDWTSEFLTTSKEIKTSDFSSDSQRLALAGLDSFIKVYDLSEAPREIPLQESDKALFTYAVALSNNGRWLAMAGHQDNLIRIWDLRSGQKTATMAGHVHGVFALSFSPDNRTLVSSTGARVIFWHVGTWRELMSAPDNVPARADLLPRLMFSPSGRYVVRAGTPLRERNVSLRFWRTPTLAEIDVEKDRE